MRKIGAYLGIIFFFLLSQDVHGMKVLINHIGYETEGWKHAVILGHEGDAIQSFKIKKHETEEVVFSGIPQYKGPVQKWKDWRFWTIDFNELKEEGLYCIECATDKAFIRSFPFLIQDNILEKNTLSDIIYYFKSQRCSGLLDKADRKMTFIGPQEGKIVDVHGGWYDATGDYGKHLSHLSFSTHFNPQQIPLVVWSLFKTYEILDGREDPNFRQYKRRLLDEAMFGADYLVRVKKPSGSFYRTVSGRGPEKKPEDRRIAPAMRDFQIKTAETKDKFSKKREAKEMREAPYEVGFRAGGGVAIAALAMAGRYEESGDFSRDDYLEAAKEAFAFLDDNNVHLTNDGKENIVDDYCALTAATELFKATKDKRYKAAADKRAQSLMGRLTSRGQYQNYWRADGGDRPFFHASDAGFPVVSLLYYLEIADEETKKEVLEIVKKSMEFEMAVTEEINNPFGYSRQLVQNKEGTRRTSFFFPHDTEASPWWQGENARLSSMAAAARLASRYFSQDRKFCDELQAFAWNQLNWILGLNPFDICMLQGSGRNNPDYMFFDSYEYTNCPGGICNGITAGLYDEEDIDFHLTFTETGADHDWRWTEQWLPHAAWYLLAVSAKE